MLADLTADELSALENYKTAKDSQAGNSYCFELNRQLSKGLWPDELSPDLRDVAKHLDAVLARSPPLATDTFSWRGEGHRLMYRDFQIGTTFRNLGFWSLTRLQTKASSFLKPVSRPGHGVVFTLKLPAGFRVFDMETLAGAGGAEAELLAPRGVLWKVLDVVPDIADIDGLTRSLFQSIWAVSLEAVGVPRAVGMEQK